jgi:hypothetical protein
MNEPEAGSFPAAVVEKLKIYVYRLIDPSNGETFYVGKGQGNRVFFHIHAELGLDGDELDNQIRRIRDIRLAGFSGADAGSRYGGRALSVRTIRILLRRSRLLARLSRVQSNRIEGHLGEDPRPDLKYP